MPPGDEACRLRDEILAGGFSAEAQKPPDADDTADDLGARSRRNANSSRSSSSNSAAGRRNPERIRSDLDAAANSAADILRRWGGSPERQIGGTVVAVFGVPSAGERDAERALHAALEVAEQAAVPVRLGVDTGVVVGARGARGRPPHAGG